MVWVVGFYLGKQYFQICMDIRKYGELKKQIPDISEKILIQVRKCLGYYGILHKKSLNDIPPRVEYTLTQKGLKVLPLIDLMKEFVSDN